MMLANGIAFDFDFAKPASLWEPFTGLRSRKLRYQPGRLRLGFENSVRHQLRPRYLGHRTSTSGETTSLFVGHTTHGVESNSQL